MNPIDAPSKDRKLYYNNTWLRHNVWGIGRVWIEADEQFQFYKLSTEFGGEMGPGFNVWLADEPCIVKAEALTCWWPRAGAYNTPFGAIYVARKAIRAMHKSAMPEIHYNIKWGDPMSPVLMMWALTQDFPRIPIEDAVYKLHNNEVTSIAINRDIILRQGLYDQIHILFRGIYVGDYNNGEFIPSFNGAPISKRILYKLLNQEA